MRSTVGAGGRPAASASRQLMSRAAFTAQTTSSIQPPSPRAKLSAKLVTAMTTSISAGHTYTTLRRLEASSHARTSATPTRATNVSAPITPTWK